MRLHLVLAALSAAALLSPADAGSRVSADDRLASGQPPILIAHRSANLGGHPENSLAWIRYALDRGVDMVHINPQLTADQRYVLMHDQTLNRTTNVEQVYANGSPDGPTREERGGKDYVRDYTLADIRNLRLVDENGNAAYPVPTLDEALELIDGRLLVLLGLKSYEVDSLAADIGQHDTGNLLLFELYFSGTDQSKLRALTERTGIGASVALLRSRDFIGDLNGIWDQIGDSLKLVSIDRSRLTPEGIARADELGVLIAISGWDGPEDEALLNAGDIQPWKVALDHGYAAFTDQPGLVLDILGR